MSDVITSKPPMRDVMITALKTACPEGAEDRAHRRIYLLMSQDAGPLQSRCNTHGQKRSAGSS